MRPVNSNKDIITHCIETNMRLKLQYIPSKLPSMSIKKIDQTFIVDSGMSTDTFNTAYGGIVTQKVANDVMQYYLKRKLPMAWWIGPFSAENKDLKKNMQAAGFVNDELDIGMYCDFSKNGLQQYQIPDKLVIKECLNHKDFSDFGRVLASVFEPRCKHVENFYEKVSTIPSQDRENLKLFVGYIDDEPIASACVFFSDVAGIYDVSTRPDMQKKGYGSAIFYTVLRFALQNGYKDIVLQASQDGLGIYKRFGFEQICEFNVWSNKDQM